MSESLRFVPLLGAPSDVVLLLLALSVALTVAEIITLTRRISPSPGVRAFAMFVGVIGAVGGTICGMLLEAGPDLPDVLFRVMPGMLIGAALGVGSIALLRWSVMRLLCRSAPPDR